MWRFVESDIKVLPLLAGVRDLAPSDMILKCFSRAADFAIDDVVLIACACCNGAIEGVFADVVDYAGDFADL